VLESDDYGGVNNTLYRVINALDSPQGGLFIGVVRGSDNNAQIAP
jgi:hypothetical protein